ncbi:MAG TPA: hypothetical protein DCZ91_16025 [Lachnospiraceae bacterium]|nr:hypothetical protein [Lachnospiraceae bacterium]
MKNRIQKIDAFRITIERRKLARDEKSVQKIFKVLEECGIPCECMAINIDWLAIVMREEERWKVKRFVEQLNRELSNTDICINGKIVLLYLENGQMTSRRIGMLISSLAIQDVDIVMQRYIRCEDRLVIGTSVEDAGRAQEIIREVIASDYQA